MTQKKDSGPEDDSVVNQADMLMNALANIDVKLSRLETIEERLKTLETKKGDVSGLISANATAMKELTAEISANKKAVEDGLGNLSKALSVHQTTIAEKFDAMVGQAKDIAKNTDRIDESVKALNTMRVTLDDATRASLEKHFQYGHTRMIESFQTTAAATIRETLGKVIPPIEGRVDAIARESFGDASKQLARKIEQTSNDAGSGLVAIACVVGAVAAVYTAWHFHAALVTDTPDVFTVRGEEGTTVEDGQGKVIGRIAA